MMNDDMIYDYIIIGGGTSGTVVARRLAEASENYSVCLIEAGPSHEEKQNSRMPGGLPKLFQEGKLDWGYRTVPQKGCNNRIMDASRGRILGGCSAINGTVFTRGVKADYDRIADMGNPGWCWDDMLPHFKISETFHSNGWHEADLCAHGNSGPLHTEPHPLMPISQKVLESFIDQGFEYKPDMFVQGEYEGVGHAVRTIHNGIRSTGADYLHNFDRENLSIRMNTCVERIILEQNEADENVKHCYRAIGVELHDTVKNERTVLKSRNEVILSAGAYNSPTILMRSGIGPKQHLSELNIDCKIDLPGVGENLLDHPIIYTSYQLNDPNLTLDRLFYHDSDSFASAIKEWQISKTGPMSRFVFGCFALKRIDTSIEDPIWVAEKNRTNCDDPSGQLSNQPHVEYFNSELYLIPPHIYSEVPTKEYGVLTMITLLCGQRARGFVRLSSADYNSKPIIDHALLEDDIDVTVLSEGCRIAHEVIMRGKSTKNIIIGPWPRDTAFPTDITQWKEYVRKFSSICGHASGTCKMAPAHDPMGVVDHRLRLRHVRGLRVADVSIMPILNSGHPQAPAYAIGEKAATMILEDIRV